MTIGEFFKACESHDWFYSFSDDHRVWCAGLAAEDKLKAEAKTDPVKQDIFDRWSGHHFSGEPWGTAKQPKPVLSDFVPANA